MSIYPMNTSNVTNPGGFQVLNFPEISLPRVVRFWLLQIFLIPSLLCSFILLYHLISNRNFRKILSNHVIILLLLNGMLIQLIDIPLLLNFLRVGSIQPPVPIMCQLRWFIDLGMFSLRGFLMAWASIEQHILVFHEQWIATRRKRIFIHYFPLVSIVIYSFVLYIYVLFFPPCQNSYIYTREWCAVPCFMTASSFGIYSAIFNSFLPTFCVLFFSIFLYVRVIRQKRRLQQRVGWRKCRKMFVQFLMIATIFLLFDVPGAILSLVTITGSPSYSVIQSGLYSYFLRIFLSLFMPFIFLHSIPEAYKKIRRTLNINGSTTTIAPAQHSTRPIRMLPMAVN